MADLQSELTALLNRYSADSRANTPDYVLAKFIISSLAAFNVAMAERDEHAGVQTKCGKISLHDVQNHQRDKKLNS